MMPLAIRLPSNNQPTDGSIGLIAQSATTVRSHIVKVYPRCLESQASLAPVSAGFRHLPTIGAWFFPKNQSSYDR